jgi:hypothetical protein
MTRRDWWLGVALVVAAVLLYALVPRYEWRDAGGVPRIRIDRWTGRLVVGSFVNGLWISLEEQQATAAAQAAARPISPEQQQAADAKKKAEDQRAWQAWLGADDKTVVRKPPPASGQFRPEDIDPKR